MRCPHCDKEITLDDGSPLALLIYLHKQQKQAKKRAIASKNIHGDENEFTQRRMKKAGQWEKWADWVEKQIERKDV